MEWFVMKIDKPQPRLLTAYFMCHHYVWQEINLRRTETTMTEVS